MKSVLTTCGYCGCGCNLYYRVKDGAIAGVAPKNDHPVSLGKLCAKGWQGYGFARHADRLQTPLIRNAHGGFDAVSWEQAISYTAQKLQEITGTYGGSAFGALSSARCTNEENYLFTKLTRAVLKSPHIDHCARL